MAHNQSAQTLDDSDSGSSLADYFRERDSVLDSQLAWQLDNGSELSDSIRMLFQGSSGLVRLRIWMLLTLVGHNQAQLQRDEMDNLFHLVRPEAVDSTLKRFREAHLLEWDETHRNYALTALGQRAANILLPLVEPEQDELASLLGQVVGAEQLGTLQSNQVHMLQAQLQRLHHEFEDAIASGSEFRLRQARQRYDRASRLIDKASEAISAIISQAKGQKLLEQAARGLGLAQSRLLAMASQFNRALQQADRQRVTLGTTGITSTDVKRWLQSIDDLSSLGAAAVHRNLRVAVLAPHEILDVTEAEFERERPVAVADEGLPQAQEAPEGNLQAVALPAELSQLTHLFECWGLADALQAAPEHSITEALLSEKTTAPTRYAQAAYKLQLLPLLGDAQAKQLPGITGELARQPWRTHWHNQLQSLDHPELSHLSSGSLRHESLPDEPNTEETSA